jgi:hypothetical protein
MLRYTMLALLLGGFAVSAAGEEAHAIKLKKLEKGDVAIVLVKHDQAWRPVKPAANELKPPAKELKELPKEEAVPEKVEEPKGAVKGGDVKPRAGREGGVFLFEETVLEVEAGKRPTRLQRRYEQAVTKKDGKETALPYEWKTVVIEKKDDKYRYLSDGTEVTGENARALDEEFARGPSPWDMNELLLPKKAVRVDEAWTIATEPYVKEMEGQKLKVDAAKSTGKGKLLKVYDKDGRRFGVIEARLEFPLMTPGEENGVPMVVDVTLDLCIDGSSTDFLRTEKTRVGDAKQATTGEGSRQVLRREVRKK